MNYIFNILRDTFSWNGRYSRGQFILAIFLYGILIAFLYYMFSGDVNKKLDFEESLDNNTIISYFIIGLGVIINHILTMKRLHDLGHSGWWALGYFIVFFEIYFTWLGFVRYIFFIYLITTEGKEGENKYGVDPL